METFALHIVLMMIVASCLMTFAVSAAYLPYVRRKLGRCSWWDIAFAVAGLFASGSLATHAFAFADYIRQLGSA